MNNEKKNQTSTKEEVQKNIKETKVEEKTIKEKKTNKEKWATFKKRIILIISFGFLGTFMYYIQQANSPEYAEIVMWNTLSIMFNFLILFVVFGTGIGIEITKRFFNRFRYNSGNYMNSLYLTKSGVILEKFVKKDKDTGDYKINRSPYIAVPQLIANYKKIPTYVHREGNPDPLNLWNEELANDLSNKEMDTVMNARGAFDFKEWLENNWKTVLFILFGVIAMSMVAAYFGFSNYKMLSDGTYTQVKVMCDIAPEAIKAAMLG